MTVECQHMEVKMLPRAYGWRARYRREREWITVLAAAAVGSVVAIWLWFYWLHGGAVNARNSLLSNLPAEARNTPAAETIAQQTTEMLSQLGQAGDSFGGLTSLFSALTVCLVLAGSAFQMLALRHEQASRRRQQFEDHFFRLLDLVQSAAAQFSGLFGATEVRRDGVAALNSFAARVSVRGKKVTLPPNWFNTETEEGRGGAQLCQLVNSYIKFAYKKAPSTFGPYLRLLYRLFRYIDDSDISNTEKEEFARIAVASLSEGTVFILALNGLTKNGVKFRPLIEKMGVLEHLHPKFRRPYQNVLLLAYRPRAFDFREWSEKAEPSPHFDRMIFEVPPYSKPDLPPVTYVKYID